MQVLISGGLGEAETGGPSINMVPKTGGNRYNGSFFYSTAGDWSSSNNLDDPPCACGRLLADRTRKEFVDERCAECDGLFVPDFDTDDDPSFI